MFMGRGRPRRMGIWVNGELEPYEAEMFWDDKGIMLKEARHRFDPRFRYPALFIDPNHAYTLVRVWLCPGEGGFFRFHHRKVEEGTKERPA